MASNREPSKREASRTDSPSHRVAENAAATSAEGARVEAIELSRSFGTHVAVDRVGLTIERGETFGLLGANGAGKTTFIRLLTGFLIPSDGDIRVDGVSPASHPRDVQQQLGYVPETSRLYPELRVQAFLRFAAGLRGLRGGAAREAVERTLSQFQLEDVARRRIGNLSKGYKQRVSLAQGFLHQPKLLIVDEPTSGLDPLQREEVRAIIESLRGRRTILVCTHDLAEARQLTSRVAVLYEGRLVASGPSEEILAGDDSLDLFRGKLGGAAA